MEQPQKKMARSTKLVLDPYSPKHTKRQRKQTPRMHTEFILHRKKKMFPWALQWQNPSRCTNACKAGPARLQRADIEQRRAPQAALTKLLFVSQMRHRLHNGWCNLELTDCRASSCCLGFLLPRPLAASCSLWTDHSARQTSFASPPIPSLFRDWFHASIVQCSSYA